MIKIKRVYDDSATDDGYRVLVDRLWPRGIGKSDLEINEWAKELAPSSDLRRSFGHDPRRWFDFRSRYLSELRAQATQRKLDDLASRARRNTVTLLYAAKDEAHNNAVILKQVLEGRLERAA